MPYIIKKKELRAAALDELNEAFDWLNENQIFDLFRDVQLERLIKINEEVKKLGKEEPGPRESSQRAQRPNVLQART